MNKIIWSLVPAVFASKCPDLLNYRTENVVKNFDQNLLAGKWYENAFNDIAQAGASCQVMENKVNDVGFEQKFSTKYGFVPFSQTYIYKHEADLGLYTKYLKGDQWMLTLPTVVVDVQLGSDGLYKTMTEYTCHSEAGI